MRPVRATTHLRCAQLWLSWCILPSAKAGLLTNGGDPMTAHRPRAPPPSRPAGCQVDQLCTRSLTVACEICGRQACFSHGTFTTIPDSFEMFVCTSCTPEGGKRADPTTALELAFLAGQQAANEGQQGGYPPSSPPPRPAASYADMSRPKATTSPAAQTSARGRAAAATREAGGPSCSHHRPPPAPPTYAAPPSAGCGFSSQGPGGYERLPPQPEWRAPQTIVGRGKARYYAVTSAPPSAQHLIGLWWCTWGHLEDHLPGHSVVGASVDVKGYDFYDDAVARFQARLPGTAIVMRTDAL